MTKTTFRKGFSLIEILIVITLFSILAFLVTQSTLQSFRGTRKADASGKVRDSLDFAASTVERNVRNAKSITSAATTCDGTSRTSLSYVDQSGTTRVFSYNGNAANGYLALDGVRITSADITVTSLSFSCTITSVVNPPVIDYVISGKALNVDTTEESFTTISRRVVLRVY